MAYLVTGKTGTEHVTGADDGAFNRGVAGSGDYLLAGATLTPSILNGKVKLSRCELVICGKHCRIEGTEEIAITATSQGLYRRDYIVGRYRPATDGTGFEYFEVDFLMGTPAATAAGSALPTLTVTDLYTSAGVREVALCEVTVYGAEVRSVTTVIPQLTSLASVAAAVNAALAPMTEKVGRIGSIVNGRLAANLALAAKKTNTVLTVTLPAGTWAVTGCVQFKAGSKDRFVRTGLCPAGQNQDAFLDARLLHGSSSYVYKVGVSSFITLTAQTAVNLNVYSTVAATALGDGTDLLTSVKAVRLV